ncbi:translocation/assembly module TamB domain-containing protein [Salinimicrobium flavum]|uniref:Translocation/assembly module TamB domain-containing protein n=1 Tax=Salinimicrobium flavum TaxID=1737065 RepID=A0ABW5J269_9FLAO
MEENKKKKKKKKKSLLGLFGKILLGIFIFLFLLLLFIRSPWGQGIIVDKVVSYISGKTNTEVRVDRLFVTFSGDISLKGLYMEDESGDTLVYSRLLEADIPLWPIIRGRGIAIDDLQWQGVRAKINRQDTVQGFNYEFLMEAFAATDTTNTTPTDTTASAMQFSLGDLDLQDFNIDFNDDVAGIESRFEVGKFLAGVEEFSLDSMKFNVADASLENTRFSYSQTKPFPQDPNAEEVPLPSFTVGSLTLNNVAGTYESIPDGILADVTIDDLLLNLPLADLSENTIHADRLDLLNSVILIHTSSISDEGDVVSSEASAESEGFQWPPWNIRVKEINLENNHFQYLVNGNLPQKGKFDPNAIDLNNFDLVARDLVLREGVAEAQVEKLNFAEASGIDLHELTFNLMVSEENLKLDDLQLSLNQNSVSGNLLIKYTSLSNFIDSPENATMAANLPGFRVDIKDLFLLQPDLKQNEYLRALSEKPVHGNLSAEGKMSAIEIKEAKINWGATTNIAARGTVLNATDPDNIWFDFPHFIMNSGRGDLQQFVKEEELGIRLPQEVRLSGNFKGTPEDIEVDATLTSSSGNIEVDGRFMTTPSIAFETNLEVVELQLGQLLQNEQLGSVSLTLDGTGSGSNVNELDAVVQANISSLDFNNYTFKNINLETELENGEGYTNLNYRDEHLNMKLEGFVQLDSIAPKLAVQLDLIGADLQALGLSKRPVNAALELKGTFEGSATEYDITANISNGIAVYSNDAYLLGDLDILAHVRPDTTSMEIKNRMLDLRLRSNTDPQEFIKGLNRHYESYFSEIKRTDTIQHPVNLELYATISPAPILNEVILPSLEEMDTVQIQVDFRERERKLTGSVNLPHLKYMGSEIDSLRLNLNSNKEDLAFDFGLKSLDAGPLAIKETIMEGRLEEEKLILDFISNHEEEKLIHVQSHISKPDGSYTIHIVPDDLILNKAAWEIDTSNEIIIGEKAWIFNNFELRRNTQLMRIRNDLARVQKEHIAFQFENFTLGALFSYLNPERVLAEGRLNGDFIIEEPFGSTGMLANLTINEFGIMEVPMGTLTLEGEAVGTRSYDFDMAVKGGDVDLDLTGNYLATEKGANLDLDLDLNEIKMTAVESFSQGALNSGEGSFSGQVKVTGTTLEPVYEGSLNFDNAGFTIATLNAHFVIADETLQVNNEGITLNDFEILDQNRNSLVLDGSITTETLLNPGFDLSLRANDFMALNSTEEDNDLFYGTAIFDATATLKGDLELPILDVDLDVGSNTNVTYIIPAASIELEEREGVVVFVNKQNPDRILTQTSEIERGFDFSGISLDATISVEEDATFTVVLDEETGDHFQASGEGDMLFNVYPNGRTTLAGRYVVNDGYYEMNLYDLVTRRFDLMEGSSITWAGDPFDADLNITAIYRVDASASALMAPQITGADVNVRNRYRQELPFLVYLNIDGQITQPILSFGLDMPESEQGAIGGQVYGRVQQINTQENELNKQVFSLLVLNRFFPDSGSDGSAGGTISFARDNLNEALSDQMNLFSDKLMGETGIDLNFGLDSYTDYQGENPEERTQLDITARKTLMDDRLIVSVGSEVDLQGSPRSGESSPVIGNVSIEYLMTEDGRFRLKAFRRNSYENVIDGQLVVSGLALIFTQEFNRFRELWNAILRDEQNQQREKKQEEEQDK